MDLVEIYKDTKNWARKNEEKLFPPAPLLIQGLLYHPLKENTKENKEKEYVDEVKIEKLMTPLFFSLSKEKKEKEEKKEKNKVIVVNMDTIDAARQLQLEGLTPLVLNMANAFSAGGGVEGGARAQEEDLFRRSDYFRHLDQQKLYPLAVDEIVVTPNVTVFKDNAYKYLDEPFTVDFVACAAICNPLLNVKGELSENDEAIMFGKCQQLLQAAAHLGYDSLVLGALGCGAFRNPPEQISKLFQKALLTSFDDDNHKKPQKIVFAVLSKNTPNFDIFFKNLHNFAF